MAASAGESGRAEAGAGEAPARAADAAGAEAARARVLALMALTLGSGATDAVAFLGLGGVFTANQTGNLVLVGLIGREDYGATALRSVIAVAAFAGALWLGFRLTRAGAASADAAGGRDARAEGRAAPAPLLRAAIPLLLLVLAGWLVADGEPSSRAMLVLLALSAAAMGLQTVAARRMTSAYGISTTFVTGTIAAVFQHLADDAHAGNRVRVGAVVALVAGALLGAGLLELAPLTAPALAPLAVVVALLALRAAER